MDPQKLDPVQLHVAGATVRHQSPFGELSPYRNETALTQEFLREWVFPYYMKVGNLDAGWKEEVRASKSRFTPDVIRQLLGDFNWRTRITGAFFAAVNGNIEFLDEIGIHLLRSEVCYAGEVYCLALAYWNTSQSVWYLNQYLDHYLRQPDLWFDQAHALVALMYLDRINGTQEASRHQLAWQNFVSNKPDLRHQLSGIRFEAQIDLISALR